MIKKIPRKVLLGLDPSYRRVHTTYIAFYIQRMMEELHLSFWVRAAGRSDRNGHSWAKLKRVTIYIKQYLLKLEEDGFNMDGEVFDWLRELAEENQDSRDLAARYIVSGDVKFDAQPQLSGSFTSRYQLTPSQRQAYDNKVSRDKNKDQSRVLKHFKSLSETQTSFSEHNVPILVRSGRLAGVLTPPKLFNNQAYFSADQTGTKDVSTISITNEGMKINLDVVPYAHDAQYPGGSNPSIREILYEGLMASIHEEARAFAYEKALEVYTTMKKLNKKDKLPPAGKDLNPKWYKKLNTTKKLE